MKGLGARLAVAYVTLILVAGSLVGLVMYRGEYAVYVDVLSTSLTRSGGAAAAEVTLLPRTGLQGFAREVASLTGARVTFIDQAGTVLADSELDPGQMENHLSRPEVQQALSGKVGRATRLSASVGERLLYVAVPVSGRGTPVRVVRLAISLAAVEAAVSRLRMITLAPLAVACVVAAIVALRAARGVTRPLEGMSVVARRLAAGDLSARAPVEGPDETAGLGRTLNLLAESLESRIAELQATREGLEELLRALPVGVIEIGRDYQLISANAAAESLLAFRIEDTRGKHYTSVLLASYALADAITRAVELGETTSLEVETGPADASVLHVNVSPRRAPGGRTDGAVLVLEDLSQTRRNERARRELVANVSHELKTPVAAIRALAETLSEGALADPEAAKRFLEHITRESERLAGLIGDLTELARLESSEWRPAREPVDMEATVAHTVDRLLPLARQKRQSLSLRAPRVLEAGQAVVTGDEKYLERAVSNLVENAIKFTPEGGEIIVSVDRAASPDQLEITVADTGPGLTPEAASRVFERFYRVDSDRARMRGGTGLGLAIVKHVALAHGGTAGVTSEGPGRGCSFWLRLPLA